MLTVQKILNATFLREFDEWFLVDDETKSDFDIEVLLKETSGEAKELIIAIFSLLPVDAEDQTLISVKEVLEVAKANVQKIECLIN